MERWGPGPILDLHSFEHRASMLGKQTQRGCVACPRSHSEAGEQGSTLACLSHFCPPPGVLMQGVLPVLPTMLHGVLGEFLSSLGLSFPFYALRALTTQRF